MSRKTVSIVLLVLLVTSMLVLAVKIQPVKASGTITINADGSITPSTVSIKRNGDTYTLTSNMTSDVDGIVIERDGVTLDGGGYAVQGAGASGSTGVSLRGNNVTIVHVEIRSFDVGIDFNSNNNNISENKITNNTWGIWPSSYNIIIGNQLIANAHHGIEFLSSASYNTVSDNEIADNGQIGIRINNSSDYNSIFRNNITENTYCGIYIAFSSNNSIYENAVKANHAHGITLVQSPNNKIFHNNFTDNPMQADTDSTGYLDIWDDGYPSGGNCWSDYTGLDFYRGPYQNETGSDGIGDTPYVINANNRDNYPLVTAEMQKVNVTISPRYFRAPFPGQYPIWVLVEEPIGNLWSYNVTIHFNNTLATALSVVDAGFLNEPYETHGTIDNAQGIVRFEASESGTAEPKAGGFPPGLCLVSFNETRVGGNLLELNAELFDKNGNPIPINCQNGTAHQEANSGYEIASSFTDYSPSGMPDFSQLQNSWPGYCASTSAADALWWLDSKVEALNNYSSTPPPTISNSCPLVTSYNASAWDDHDPRNVPPLIEELAYLMDTNGVQTGIPTGPNDEDVQAGVSRYFRIHGINPVGDADGDGMVEVDDLSMVQFALGSTPGSSNWDSRADLNMDNKVDSQDVNMVESHIGQKGMFSMIRIQNPTFTEIKQQFEQGSAVVLKMNLDYLGNTNLCAHVFALAGLNSTTQEIVIHDPNVDFSELNRSLTQLSPPHTHPIGEQGYTVHNDARYVSNDAFVLENDSISSFIRPPVAYIDNNGRLFLSPPGEWRITWALSISYIPPNEDDIAVVNVSSSRTIVAQSSTARIDALVVNRGRHDETFNVTARANTTTIDTLQNVAMTSQTINAATFTWNTTGLGYGKYILDACATPVPNETNTSDNNCTGWVIITIPGDTQGDFKVSLTDLVLLANAYGSKAGNAKWNPNADINGNGAVDLADLVILAQHYGQHYP